MKTVPHGKARKGMSGPKQGEDLISLEEYIVQSIASLNFQTGRRFKTKSRTTHDLLYRLYRQEYKIQDVKKVIDLKVSQWNDANTMRKYLSPTTLFDLYNFKRYLDEASDEL